VIAIEPGCKPTALGGTASAARGPNDYDLPPVFPVVNAIIGGMNRWLTRSIDGSDVNGNASALGWAGTGANTAGTLTITLGAGTGTAQSGVVAGTPVLTPSPLITDRAGNPVAGTYTGASSRF